MINAKISRTTRPYLKDLYYRRLAQGPEEYRPRSDWLNWNREAELYAFTNRIDENIPRIYLEKIFTDKSYIDFISKTSNDSEQYLILGNDVLINIGFEFAQKYISAFLSMVFSRFPDQWISTICDYLLSTSELAFIGSHLGIGDIVLYSDFKDYPTNDLSKLKIVSNPPSVDIIANTLMALIGTLVELKVDDAELFVNDFILIRLADLDLIDLIKIPKPIEMLTKILESDGLGPPETRLQNQCGMNTILACYQVGIYSNQELIGEAPGETLPIAEEEAACQAIRSYYGLTESRIPITLNSSTRNKLQSSLHQNRTKFTESYLEWKSNLPLSE